MCFFRTRRYVTDFPYFKGTLAVWQSELPPPIPWIIEFCRTFPIGCLGMHYPLSLLGTDDSMAVRITRRKTGTRKTPTRRVYTPVKTRRYGGPVYRSSMWKAGMAVGLVYGLTRYKTRRMYLRYPNRGNFIVMV